jgi:hypothetical protein
MLKKLGNVNSVQIVCKSVKTDINLITLLLKKLKDETQTGTSEEKEGLDY